MADNLVIFGTTHLNVPSIKATDTNNIVRTYIRPQGTKSITENGDNIDVSAYAIASVNVDRTGGHVDQQGSSIVIPAEEVDSGYSVNEIATRAYSGNIELTTATSILTYAFASSAITGISSTSVLNGYASCFAGCTRLVSVNLPNIKTPSDGSAVSWFEGCSALTTLRLPAIDRVWNYMFKNCTSLTTLVLPALKQLARPNSLDGDTALKYIDIGGKNNGAPNSLANSWAKNCSSFDTFILRYSTLVTLSNVGAFSGTPFDSGGTGGTIYIPKSLYDCLGDGTSSDYKAATNWSTVDGYGTITWAQIEGSYYETHYADGTEIPST